LKQKVRGDGSVLQRYAERGPNDFLRYRTLLGLARDPWVAASKRLDYLDRVMAFGLISPLSRDDIRRAQLELAELAVRAGQRERALAAYQRALPLEAAAAGLTRLEPEPRALARLFLDAREPLRALSALGSAEAPAVRAPAHAALGEYETALAAYERWLTRSPGSLAAREGNLQALIALGRHATARQLLTTLPLQNLGQDDRWLEAAAALAEAEGDEKAAAAAYIQLGSDAGLWQASRLLELQRDFVSALPLYLELSQSSSDYQDDAAYRAYVLATRLGYTEVAAIAAEQVPTFSFFGLLLGNTLPPPTAPLPHIEPAALRRARALERVGDREAALGELLVALRQATDEATTVALAEALQKTRRICC
jgi:soluble lytic murein transglycosylase